MFGAGAPQAWPARLQDGDVVVRPLEVRDQEAWLAVRAQNEEWLGPWEATAPEGAGEPPKNFRELAQRLRKAARLGTMYPFVVEVDGRFAGQVTVSNVVRGSAQFASVGYWLGQEFAGRGVMPRAVALVIDHCFTVAGLHRIEICVRPENSNSLRVVEKLGLLEVGFAPRYLHIDGDWRDHRIYAVTREEVSGSMIQRLRSHP